VARAGKVTAKRGLGYWLAVGFGAGHAPVIAGTVGTVPLWLAVFLIAQVYPLSPLVIGVAAVVLAFVGFWAASEAEVVLGHDPKAVVIDEWVGMLIALAGVPARFLPYLWAFLLFRFFDVIKPFPARQLERLPRGYGVVMDDVCAGLYALASYHLLHMLWPAVF
jgi:phosphatidylglycerophosphatase A